MSSSDKIYNTKLAQIQSLLQESPSSLKDYTSKILLQIKDYEIYLYSINKYNQQEEERINSWRKALIKKCQKIKNSTKKDDKKQENTDDNTSLDILRIINTEIQRTDKNIKTLNKTTLTLKDINLSSADIQKHLENNDKIMQKNKHQEATEIKRVKFGFLVLLAVIFYIIADRTKIIKVLIFFISKILKSKKIQKEDL